MASLGLSRRFARPPGHVREISGRYRDITSLQRQQFPDSAAAPVVEKYTGMLGAVDVFTVPTAFPILESIRLDLGYRMDVHP